LNDVKYDGLSSSVLSAISPRVGNVVGGDEVTFTGTGLVSDKALYKITIDGIDCPVKEASSTSVSCTTNKRPGLVQSSLEIFIEGKGLVSNKGLIYRYCNYWSADTTWGGEFAPMEMESVYIPVGLNLLVDVDSTPQLNAVLVMGSLIYYPNE
jgi:hypothetical protein